ncbi:MAG: PLP-dependent aminotransferase family protein [Spirochaetales bacterium]|uniref:PLP-dependent aminotransferase family protein n=1 Tax=Candidatus Thalassospirochaeta sargassi TaxID=3119039 RepID=A0AAJ1IEE5_9SPIO|nr:PLP-dependent aminotransferase family protein [Spirochaetales bacterium]
MNYTDLLADRTGKMGASAIREILKVVGKPGMVSLAGGIPSPDSFPMDTIKDLIDKVMSKYGSSAFQYDLSEGFTPLREAMADYLGQKGIRLSPEQVLIQSGSQGVLDSLCKVLVSKGDKIAVEAPTYLGAIQAFKPYEPCFIEMEMDDEGLIPESLEETLKNHNIKFVYTVPTFQNPTGRSISIERRKEIAEIILKYDALLVEDDPYSNLRYTGEPVPAIKTMAPDNVVYVTTLSKVLAPGLRIGVVAAPETISEWMVVVKQGVDLHTATFSQAIAAEYVAGGFLNQQLPKIIELYRPRHAAMLNALEKYFPADFTFSRPEGGMFIWVEGPEGLNLVDGYWQAVEQNVAYVPGKYFYTEETKGFSTMRLNFTMSEATVIESAIEKLAGVLKTL